MSRKWAPGAGLGTAALVAAVALVGFAPPPAYPAAHLLWEKSEQAIGRTPSTWPTIHRQFSNSSIDVQRGATGGPDYLTEMPTLVSSDPVVANHEMFIAMSSGGRLPNRIMPGFVIAMRPENGDVLWQRELANSVASEPIVADGLVFVGEGNAVFRSDLPFPMPSVERSTVRGTGPSAIYAFSAMTGKTVWEHPTVGSDQPSPTFYQGRLYVVNGARQLDVFDAHNGRLLWHMNLGIYVSRSSPRIANNTLFVGGGGPDAVVAVSLATHRILWRRQILGAIGGVDDTPLSLVGSTLYGEAMMGSPYLPILNLQHRQLLFALDASDGRILWEKYLSFGYEPRYKQGSTAIVHKRTLYVGNAITGKFFAINRETGATVWSVKLPDPVTRPTTWVDGKIVGITTHGLLFSINQNGTDLRTHRLGPWVNAYGPVVINLTLFATGNDPHAGFLRTMPLESIAP